MTIRVGLVDGGQPQGRFLYVNALWAGHIAQLLRLRGKKAVHGCRSHLPLDVQLANQIVTSQNNPSSTHDRNVPAANWITCSSGRSSHNSSQISPNVLFS